ncbi:MAG: chloride channel protein [Dehalococcoidales bacterium]|jgi:CIC family chloride channel protein|nr:chloride channel protein [Dehalococcoidales bacterium]MDD3265029.1 chloride channel protein [Dehalococcoidales bacterium]MDD4322289.1 chloride channel protein [Dehalococcoidales bacterium]MDD4794131.1 chloride channel protein [Dehalococcoidales bacterium]MDD5498727.1 chloride channel protein [Dehalococcoidales bacterium]
MSIKSIRNLLSVKFASLRSNELVFGVVLSVIVGITAGFGAVLFWLVIKWTNWLFFYGGSQALPFMGDYYVIFLPAAGGLLVGIIIRYLANEVKGEGPPEVMEAYSTKSGRMHWKVTPIKILASAISIGSGGSVGREGPIVQIGASAGSSVAQLFKLNDEWIKILLLCGAAGGISATFNAPLAGIIFALEVVAGNFINPRFGYIVLSSVSANVIAEIFLFTGEHTASFSLPQYHIVNYLELVPYAILGILIAISGVAFVRFFYKTEELFSSLKIPQVLKPAIGGLAVGIIGYFFPEVFGVGYGIHYDATGAIIPFGALDQALTEGLAFPTLMGLFFLKMLTTSITLGSGGSGGVFAPSLFVGAMAGGAFGYGLNMLLPGSTATYGAYALVGMGAFFAVVARGPITAIIILFELTLNYTLILPLMTAVVVATTLARSFNPESIYTERLLRKGINVRKINQVNPMKEITVSQIMTRNFPTVEDTMPVDELSDKLKKSGHHGFPVLDQEENLLGVVTVTDVVSAMQRGSTSSMTVADIATRNPRVAYPDQTVHDVMVLLGTDIGRIPVVDRQNPKKLLGVLRRHNIVSAYTRSLAKK